ncbi:MAG: cytochrome C oxidase subunit IV family protein [Hyphomicrobiaceae bacterium]|nr:cytochrome C oxidase subunit IV family protein [Hyphomicrobiaceae bacterium]
MSATRTLVLAWSALMCLLFATVGASFVLTGPWSIVTSLAIALAKAALIFWFFMHLREEAGLVRLVAIGAGAWLLILILLSMTDYATRPALGGMTN